MTPAERHQPQPQLPERDHPQNRSLPEKKIADVDTLDRQSKGCGTETPEGSQVAAQNIRRFIPQHDRPLFVTPPTPAAPRGNGDPLPLGMRKCLPRFALGLLLSSQRRSNRGPRTTIEAFSVVHNLRHSPSWSAGATLSSSHRSTIAACRAAPSHPLRDNDGDLSDDNNDGDNDAPTNNDSQTPPNFYDDFGGQIIGGSLERKTSSAGGSPSSIDDDAAGLLLGERMRGVTMQEETTRQQTQDNWKRGHWEVRGFRLDPDPPIEALTETSSGYGKSSEDARIHVCLVASDPDDPARLWVGRTDGSLLAVQMGNEFLTSFQSKLSATYAADTGAATIAPTLVNVQDTAALDSTKDEDDEEDETTRRKSFSTNPFELEFQGSVPGGRPLSKLLIVVGERSEDASSRLLVATKDSGDIVQYRIDEGGDRLELHPLSTLHGGHGTGSNVVLLQRITSVDTQGETKSTKKTTTTVVSVADDGTVALWDMASSDGPLIYHCQLGIDPKQVDAAREPVTVCSADCDDQFLFLGTIDGRILVYELHDLVRAAESPLSDRIPMPCGQWVTSAQHQQSITALKCAGPGSLGQQQHEGRALSITLLTGDRSGAVKQWDVFSRTSEPDKNGASTTRVDHWPKLATQRLPQRAHAFRSMHTAAVTSLLPLNDGTIVSASNDGSIVAWNPATGKPHFFMDGFEPAIRSLCWQDNTLVTDGMKHLVCVHDFGIEPPEEEDEDSWDFDFGEPV